MQSRRKIIAVAVAALLGLLPARRLCAVRGHDFDLGQSVHRPGEHRGPEHHDLAADHRRAQHLLEFDDLDHDHVDDGSSHEHDLEHGRSRRPPRRLLPGKNYEVLPTKEKVVALTFDAAYDPAPLKGILAALADAGADATFFLTGEFVRDFPSYTKLILEAGYPIGNHSYTHPDFTDPERRRR